MFSLNILPVFLHQSLTKLANAVDSLSPTPAKKLQEEIEALKTKTEMNRAQALDAKDTADAALVDATDAKKVNSTNQSLDCMNYILTCCVFNVLFVFRTSKL